MCSDEDAWQAHFDEHPDDHQGRTVYADWLEDRDDPRAAGYRAMGALEIAVEVTFDSGIYVHDESRRSRRGAMPPPEYSWFPKPWFDLAVASRVENGLRSRLDKSSCCGVAGFYSRRRDGMDFMARLWAKLTPEQQAEILSRVEVTV